MIKFPSLCHERYNKIVFAIIIEVPRLSLKAAFNSHKELGPRITTKLDILLLFLYVLTGLIHVHRPKRQTQIRPIVPNMSVYLTLTSYNLFPSLMHGLFLTMLQCQPYLRTMINAKLIDLSQFLFKLYILSVRGSVTALK